ncbi:MAG: formyl transferase [Pseudanabaena sp. M38BS1SP1A06MG]|jgi:methionyl-tRNA formyltransferase|nr:formyl transferase [Pseudanabaena sp. M53BS1SP1A06MG]MCA6583291.1 formyl transferase [Pseudanabaena sp. M34BS1SP1A06MG]MCA6591065.1 formyl transferase [Pseudanabaena sp. M38BS1SP1A06MG]
MKILLLSPYRRELIEFLESCGDEVISTEERVNSNPEIVESIDFVISYGYRHILKEDLIGLFPNKIINIHISFLPWNRGADPNLWSFLENTPKGVSIHCIDYGIDTGNILVQKEIFFAENDTLKTSYYKLTATAFELFKKHWNDIKRDKIVPKPQNQNGSFHRLKDRQKYEHLLDKGWDTPIKNLIGKAL